MTDIPTNHTDNAGKVRKSSLLDRLSSSIIRIRKNPGLSLLGLNIILALIVFFIFDPFGWIRTSYLDADSFLDVEPARIDLIQVVDLSNPENSGFSIQRGGAVAVNVNVVTPPRSAAAISPWTPQQNDRTNNFGAEAVKRFLLRLGVSLQLFRCKLDFSGSTLSLH